MKRLGIIVSVLLMLSLMGCGSRADDEDLITPILSKGSKKSEARNQSQKSKMLPQVRIKNISFSRQLGKDGTAFKLNVETTMQLEENQHISYVFWKNGKKIQESPSDTLPPSAYKKGDVIFAEVRLQEEDQLLDQRRSQKVMMSNSSPIITEVNIPEIDGPGIYRIFVTARDPDGDKITFSLAGDPLPQGIEIDSTSGTITLSLGEEPPPEILKLIVIADDGNKGITKKAVNITFNITRQEEAR